ncbi:MAG: type II toxin-antitoxin system VapC family toxin [Deltaproteobacteria bacterium]|nr:type II toxin-antitoxin system VapC family toxin [Deltaproteobacteria bacterium]
MNVVDSSAWLEYFADGPNADFFAPAVETVDRLLVPAVCFYEVFKKVLRERGEGEALQAAALMRQGRVIPLDEGLALEAAKLSMVKKLPMADSVVLATAWSHRAVLWTQDADFEGLDSVQFKRRP